MKSIMIRLETIEDVKDFVSIMVQLASGRYVVDAKSVMGIFSMDLSKALVLRILETNERIDDILTALKSFIVEE